LQRIGQCGRAGHGQRGTCGSAYVVVHDQVLHRRQRILERLHHVHALVRAPGGALYLYHNDESQHDGVHRWRFDGAETLRELEFLALVLPVSQ
jgi:hypothetical protein